MKKVQLIIIALITIFAMTACSNNDTSKTDNTTTLDDIQAQMEEAMVELPAEEPFMKVTIPEGWEYDEAHSTSSQIYIIPIDRTSPDPKFQFNKSSGEAQAAYDEDLEFWGEKRTPMEDKMYGFYNYKRLGFTWNNDAASVSLFTDWDNNPGKSIKVNCFCIDPEDPIIQEIMQSASYF